jgi:hypothetical protein
VRPEEGWEAKMRISRPFTSGRRGREVRRVKCCAERELMRVRISVGCSLQYELRSDQGGCGHEDSSLFDNTPLDPVPEPSPHPAQPESINSSMDPSFQPDI